MSGTPILTAAQMRAAEQAVFDRGVPDYDLMERAGAAAAEIIWRAGHRRDTLVLCGPGNNGGDGFVIARLLAARGVPVRVAALAESRTESGRRARAGWHGPVEALVGAAPATQIVDALFGTGLSRGLDDAVAAHLCALVGAASYSYAIDLPSGVETDSGALLSGVPDFTLCIALGALKPAHVLEPAAGKAARLVCADIGIDAGDALAHRLAPPALTAPGRDDHKYRRGLIAVVEGAMPGAAMLAAGAAARAGAGYVKLVGSGRRGRIPLSIVQTPDEGALADERVAAVLVGPGLGRGNDRVRAVLSHGHAAVVDADGLIGLDLALLPDKAILTPHEGEFRALFGDLTGSKIDRARAAAARAGAVVLYKGADTVIAAPDGRCVIGVGASSWLSTAGTGDVLAGICAARLAVTGDPFRAACEAAWLHGEAARRAGAAFVADDLIERLGDAIASRL